jgi:hypothetical protein
MDFHCSRIQKAKRQYRCYSTGALIKPGDKYYYLCGSNEGDFYSLRMHFSVFPVYSKLNSDYWRNNHEALYFDEVLTQLQENPPRVNIYKNGQYVDSHNKNFLRNLGFARRIAKLEGVPGWFSHKFTK